ncbi:MAG: hypothetical protein IJI05_00805 [Erysipelotrichaceae bacterium]|nr:hypothetical protein [Erysipelotrichaceae bacterium]
MQDILLNYGEYIMFGICAVDVLLLLSSFTGIFRTKRFVTFLTFILIAGITFDAAVIATGALADTFPILQQIHTYRFLVKGIVMPLMIVIAFYAMEPTAGGQAIAWVIGLIAMGVSGAAGWFTQIETSVFADFYLYGVSAATPQWVTVVQLVMPIVSAVFLLLSAIAVVAAKKNVALIFAVIF